MEKHLPARPNLDHLKRQAKTLLSQVQAQSTDAIVVFRDFNLDPNAAKLADAQLIVARQIGFESWPRLVRYIETLHELEGTWEFTSLEVDGTAMPAGAFAQSKLILNGDRFNMLSPEGDYVGVFDIRLDGACEIDIEFIEGPEAGNSCYGIFRLEGNELTICLGLVGASRPTEFVTKAGTGHALESFRRVRSDAPVRKPKESVPTTSSAKGNPSDFEEVTPAMEALQGDWIPLEVVNSGQTLPANFLPMGVRSCIGTRTTVTFGGQKMVDVFSKAFDDGAIDYLVASGPNANDFQYGIYRLDADVLTVCMADSGQPRPTDFTSELGSGHTLTRWAKK